MYVDHNPLHVAMSGIFKLNLPQDVGTFVVVYTTYVRRWKQFVMLHTIYNDLACNSNIVILKFNC